MNEPQQKTNHRPRVRALHLDMSRISYYRDGRVALPVGSGPTGPIIGTATVSRIEETLLHGGFGYLVYVQDDDGHEWLWQKVPGTVARVEYERT